MKKLALLFILLFSALLFAPTIEKWRFKHRYGNSVVKLLSGDGGGTGFQVKFKEKQFTLTNDHICAGAPHGYLIAEVAGLATHFIKILSRSPKTDLCLLEPVKELPPLELGKEEFRMHEKVFIIGHPRLRPLELSEGKSTYIHEMEVSIGYITDKQQLDDCKKPKNKIVEGFFGLIRVCVVVVRGQETSAHIEPGNSGSPVLDQDGFVRGVAFASGPSQKADIIPLKDMLEFLNESYQYVPLR